jgi:hypothetical protein
MIVNHLFPLYRHFIIIQPKPLKHLGELPSFGPQLSPGPHGQEGEDKMRPFDLINM